MLTPTDGERPLLEGLLVVELASVLAGPTVGMALAEMGARVVKVENPGTGDVTRQWYAIGETGDRPSSYFASANWGKEFMAADLTVPEDKDRVLNLLKQADIAIVSFKPGDAEKFGLTWGDLQPLNPNLVYASIVGYSESEPYVAYDAVIQAETGFIYLNSVPGGPPLRLPVAFVDLFAAHQMREAIMAALYRRATTGKGSNLRVSLWDAAISALANMASTTLMAGRDVAPSSGLHPSIAPYGEVLECADGGHLFLAIGNNRQFQRFCALLGQPQLAEDARFATNPARVENRTALWEALQQAARHLPAPELEQQCKHLQIPAACIATPLQALRHPRSQGLVYEKNGLFAVKKQVVEGLPKKEGLEI